MLSVRLTQATGPSIKADNSEPSESSIKSKLSFSTLTPFDCRISERISSSSFCLLNLSFHHKDDNKLPVLLSAGINSSLLRFTPLRAAPIELILGASNDHGK
jgi:hypothetical protein